jgi:hypothetical protein
MAWWRSGSPEGPYSKDGEHGPDNHAVVPASATAKGKCDPGLDLRFDVRCWHGGSPFVVVVVGGWLSL